MPDESQDSKKPLLTRRDWLKAGSALGLTGAASSLPFFGRGRSNALPQAAVVHPAGLATNADSNTGPSHSAKPQEAGTHHGPPTGQSHTMGEVDHARNGFDPRAMLHDFDYGRTSVMEDGRTLREYDIIAQDREIEIAPGIYFPAWTFNGRVPGPTIRCVEGDRIRIRFQNAGSHPHTIHFHGIHEAVMDGVPGQGAGLIESGAGTVYEFDAFPFGCHLYHCHATPLKRHIHKGLYGAFIVDPDPARYTGAENEQARRRNHQYDECKAINEMVMVMNGFDTNFDSDNEVYAANTVAFAYINPGIPISNDRRQRVYLINLTEFDPINSFHLHGNFFDYYDHGTTLEPTQRRIDTVMQCQGQRGILEFSYEGFKPGSFMFHAHQSEFAELGWMGFFDVVDGRSTLS